MKKYFNNQPTFCSLILVFFLTWNGSFVFGQPSGGPYGPIDQSYEIPETNGTIFYVSPEGKEDNSGTIFNKPTTLSSAVNKAISGDVIVLRGGTYRTGNLRFNQGITLQAFKNEKPVVKGTSIASEWEKMGDELWATSWPHLFPSEPESWWRRDRNEKFTPLHRFNDDMVFIDGDFLQSAGSTDEVDKNTFYIDYEKELVYIGVDPSDKLVEITAFNVAIHRIYTEFNGLPSDGIGPKIRGIKFTQYADTAILIEGKYPEGLLDESEYGNDVKGTILENCEISWCSRIGAYIMGDSLTIRNCIVSNTSTEGIYLVGVSDALIEKTIVTKNNIEILTGFFPAAVKIFNQCYRVTCRDNLVIDLPYSNGIWYDVGNVDGVFINNWVENVGDTEKTKFNSSHYRSGFFFEISKGALCAGNVFLNCDNGSFVLNSCDVEFYQNTYINSKVAFRRTERSAVGDHFGWHPSTGPDIDERDGHVFMNNLIYQSEEEHDPFLEVSQSLPLCGTLSTFQLKQLDNNVYLDKTEDETKAVIIWSTNKADSCEMKLYSPLNLTELYPDFSVKSILLKNPPGSFFIDESNKDYRLKTKFPGYQAAGQLPENIVDLLDLRGRKKYIGAFPRIEAE